MPQHTILAKKVTLTADVKAGQIVSWSGEPATTGSKEPAGVAQYDGKTGDTIALTVIGLEDVPGTGLAVGDGVKAAPPKPLRRWSKSPARKPSKSS